MRTHYDRATDLRARLEVAAEAKASDDLLDRAREIRTQLLDACEHVEAFVKFRTEAHVSDASPIDSRALRQSIGRFRGALSSGSAALQQQFAVTMLAQLDRLRQGLRRATRSEWRSLFADVGPLLERESAGIGTSDASRRRAAVPAHRLRAALVLDPIEGLVELERLLRVNGMSASVAALAKTAEELREAIAAVDLETQSLTPEVREVLEQAETEDGYPVARLTSRLIDDLRVAGVLDTLFVHRS